MFSTLNFLPADPIYGMQVVYKKDPRTAKINLSIGVCLDETGKVLRFQAVEEAEARLCANKPSKEYLPITGLADFCQKSQELICSTLRTQDLFSTQTVGGTGALYIAALLLRSTINQIYIPEPSWANHRPLFHSAGYEVESYPYYHRGQMKLDFDGCLQAIAQMPHKSAIVFQASCHNPTGIDPDPEQWQAFSHAVHKQALIPIFDLAYLGLGTSLEDDVEGIRLFLQDGHEMLIATTFAKSLGLYNDRLGMLTVASKSDKLEIIASHIRAHIRSCYSSPPAHGALLASEIYKDKNLLVLWKSELQTVCHRLQKQRKMLYEALCKHKAPFAFEHLLTTKGLFCLFDLTEKQVAQLRDEKGIYLSLDGRLSLAAITEENVDLIASSLSGIS